MQDRYRGGGGSNRQGGGGGGGGHYGAGGGGGGGGAGGGRRRRGRGGGRRDERLPDMSGQEVEEHGAAWEEDFEREPNPDAGALHLAYDSVYTHEGDVR